MMIDTILLILLTGVLIALVIYSLIKGDTFKIKKILPITLVIIAIITIFFYSGSKKITSDLSRIINNSRPKLPSEIYTVLFKKPLDSCVTIINLKDQIIPKIDCCIWMEVRLCPAELNRIIALKNYKQSVYNRLDSSAFLQRFEDKPVWWLPQNIGDSLTELNIVFSATNQQSIFFGADSSHVFICDKAL